MNKRIFIKDWLLFKPYQKQTITDTFYLKLSNDVKHTIKRFELSYMLERYLDDEQINQLACFLTSYFEDIISDTNIWNSFVRMYKRLYKKSLPFWTLDEYYEGEINQEDISFLIWYFLNTIQDENFISPFSIMIDEISDIVFNVFYKAWDYAPENSYLKSFYQIDITESDFYTARNLIDTVLFKSYLFYTDTSSKLRKKESEIIEKYKNHENILSFLNDNRDLLLHNSHTCLLSLSGKVWVSEILGKDHSLSSDFLNISQKINSFFLYKGQDDTDIFLEHIASGKKFKLTKKSFDNSGNLKEIDTTVFIGIVKWKDEWWFSGIQFQAPFNADLVMDERNSIESRMKVNFLDNNKKINEILENQLKAFKDFNNDSLIAFMRSDKIDEFIKGFTEVYNKSLNLSAKEFTDAKKRSYKEGYFEKDNKTSKFTDELDSGLVFFNSKSGCEIAFGINAAFPMPDNPYFEKELSEEHVMRLLTNQDISSELAMFCIHNCKKDLPFFNNRNGKKYLKDIDFLLRFWKIDNYHSKPSITFIG